MNRVVDANLSPQWAALFERAGHEAVHWFDVGALDASDRTIMAWAHEREHLVFTHDLDFSALLAATQATGPSVLQVRAQDVLPGAMEPVVLVARPPREWPPHESVRRLGEMPSRRGAAHMAFS